MIAAGCRGDTRRAASAADDDRVRDAIPEPLAERRHEREHRPDEREEEGVDRSQDVANDCRAERRMLAVLVDHADPDDPLAELDVVPALDRGRALLVVEPIGADLVRLSWSIRTSTLPTDVSKTCFTLIRSASSIGPPGS